MAVGCRDDCGAGNADDYLLRHTEHDASESAVYYRELREIGLRVGGLDAGVEHGLDQRSNLEHSITRPASQARERVLE